MDFQTIDMVDAAGVLMNKGSSPTPRGFSAAKSDREAFDYVLNLIHSDKLTPEQQTQVMHDTLDCWHEHVNGGFLKYRKSVADDFAAIEWRDGEPGGATMIDIAGNEYIDCLGGFGIYNVGHSHPRVVAAVRAQLGRQCLNSQELLDPLRAYAAALLVRTLPGDLKYAFFTNSGTESVEASLKFAMMATGRRHFIGLIGAFHGKTLGALSATSKACFRKDFGGGLLPFTHVPPNDIEALRHAFASAAFTGAEVAGVILEPVLGEGGIHILTDEYLRAARRLCDDAGAMLIFDEVQSGMGRTGRMWACDHAGVAPDIMAIAKAFGGGVMPAGACVGTERVWAKYLDNPFLVTTTFGGNPLSLAAAIATMDVLQREGLVDAAAAKGAYLLERLLELQARFPGVLAAVRGRGLMIGLEFTDNDKGYAFSKGAFARRVIIAGTLVNARVIRVEPPLTITYAQMDTVLERFAEALQDVADADAALAAAPQATAVVSCTAAAASTTATLAVTPDPATPPHPNTNGSISPEACSLSLLPMKGPSCMPGKHSMPVLVSPGLNGGACGFRPAGSGTPLISLAVPVPQAVSPGTPHLAV